MAAAIVFRDDSVYVDGETSTKMRRLEDSKLRAFVDWWECRRLAEGVTP